MDVVVAITQIVSTLVLAITLVAVIIYTIKTSEMAVATAEMAKATQEQRYDSCRPLLVPSGLPIFQDDHAHWLRWDANAQDITLRNVGTGVALSVASVLYGCEWYVVGDLGNQQRSEETRSEHWTCWLGTPVAANESQQATHKAGASIFNEDQRHIGAYRFNAPPEPFAGELIHGTASVHSARITTTYCDVFGRKHASIFDYVQHTGGWQVVAFVSDISQTLSELEGTTK